MLKPTGKEVRLKIATIARWENGRIAEEYLFWDNADWNRQIGPFRLILPPPQLIRDSHRELLNFALWNEWFYSRHTIEENQMKIIIVGASGRIGKEVDKALSARHEIIRVGAHSGDVQADYTDTEIHSQHVRKNWRIWFIDLSCGWRQHIQRFRRSGWITDYEYGFDRKFLGQVRLLKYGSDFVRNNGSFRIYKRLLKPTIQIQQALLQAHSMPQWDTFVNNTAPLLPRGIRLNVVSPCPHCWTWTGRPRAWSPPQKQPNIM